MGPVDHARRVSEAESGVKPPHSKTVVARPLVAGTLLISAGLLGLGMAGRGPRAVRLRQSFEAGRESTYNFTGTLRQESVIGGRELSYELAMTGMARQVVAEVDPNGGVALVGQLARTRWERREGSDGAPVTAKEQTWTSAWRIGPAGTSVRRPLADVDQAAGDLQRTASQIGESPQACAAFPAKPVARGSRWAGEVLLPVAGMRVPARGVSTLVELLGGDDATSAVIRTEIASENMQAHTDWLPAGWLPDMTVTGAALAQLDLRQGVWQRIEWNLGVKLEGSGFDGQMHIASLSELASTRRLSKEAAAEWRARVRSFDAVVADLYRPGGLTQAIARISELKKEEADEGWHDGLVLTLAMIDPAHRAPSLIGLEAQGEARDSSPARTAIETADLAALAERWQEAVTAYLAVADRYPDDEIAAEALAAAAAIYERRLSDPSAAAALYRRIVTWRERRGAVGTNAVETYKLAGALAKAGESEKAAQSYERFLADAGADTPAWMRVLAQYRTAELRETLGQRAPALAGFKAVLALPADDDYSNRLKDKARRRIAAWESAP